MKMKEIFDFNQGHQITDEEIYQDIPNKGSIPILTANNIIKGFWTRTIVGKEDLPCITYPSKANAGVCFVQHSIFDANNTVVLIPKEEWKDKISLDWFAFKLSKLFPKIATSKEGVNYLNKEIVEEEEIDVPDKKTQIEQYRNVSRLIKLKTELEQIIEKINTSISSTLVVEYRSFRAKKVPAKKIFICISGNSGLTEQYLYQNSLFEKDKKYTVLTGSIETDTSQKTNLCPSPKRQTKKIRTFSGEGIHVVRKGKAGVVNYLPRGDYTLNDDAYILALRYQTHDISLKWIAFTQEERFLEYSSSSDNGTWNKSGFFEHAEFDIPSLEEQESVAKNFEKLHAQLDQLNSLSKKIKWLLDKEIY